MDFKPIGNRTDSSFYQEETAVRFCQCDFSHRLKLSELFRLFSDLAVSAFAFRGMDTRFLLEHQMVFLISRMAVGIRRMPLEGETRPVVKVSPILTKQNVVAIRDALDEIDQRRELESARAFLKKLLHKELYFRNISFADEADCIQFLGQKCMEHGYATEAFVQDVLLRESLSCTAFTSALAVPHAVSRYAEKSFICVLHNDMPIAWKDKRIHFVLMIGITQQEMKYFKDAFNLIVELFCRKSQPVYINGPFRHGSRRSDGHPGYVHGPVGEFPVTVMPVRTWHVDILYPGCTPPLEIHIEIEMADFLFAPVPESKTQRGIHRGGIVNPYYDAGSVHFHGSLDIGAIIEDQSSLPFPCSRSTAFCVNVSIAYAAHTVPASCACTLPAPLLDRLATALLCLQSGTARGLVSIPGAACRSMPGRATSVCPVLRVECNWYRLVQDALPHRASRGPAGMSASSETSTSLASGMRET